MTLSVIGAGFGRTGNLSLKVALESLGFGPCRRELEDRHVQKEMKFWQRVFNHGSIDWDELFDGYRSTVDFPSCKFYLELAEKYPSAKVILTWRDSNAWFDSYQETVLFPMITSFQGAKHFSFLFDSHTLSRDSMIAAYERHNAEVQRLIPAERLLVYEISYGWQPICDFLGVPVPGIPFPHLNSRADFSLSVDVMLARL